jgi:hypothetical protein
MPVDQLVRLGAKSIRGDNNIRFGPRPILQDDASSVLVFKVVHYSLTVGDIDTKGEDLSEKRSSELRAWHAIQSVWRRLAVFIQSRDPILLQAKRLWASYFLACNFVE